MLQLSLQEEHYNASLACACLSEEHLNQCWHSSIFDMKLTLQLHKPHIITKVMMVVLVKLPHCLIKYFVLDCITRLSKILQMHFDITQELVILGEDRNNGD